MKNVELTQYGAWRLRPVHLVAKAFGVLVKVDGIPFGSNRLCDLTPGVNGSTAALSDPRLPSEGCTSKRPLHR